MESPCWGKRMNLFFAIASLVVSVIALLLALRNRKRLKRYLGNTSIQLTTSLSDAQEGSDSGSSPGSHGQGERVLEQLLHEIQDCRKHIEHLRGEALTLAVLPACHPTRVALCEELRPRMAPITDKLTQVLFPNQLPYDELDWMYRMPERKFPYSLTFEEGMIMYQLISSNKLRSGYEIATAFGFSSFFIALALQLNAGKLTSVDAYIEEEKEDYLYEHSAAREHVEKLREIERAGDLSKLPPGLRFAREGAKLLGIEDVVSYQIGCSPEDIPAVVGDQVFDFAFIDGGHFGEQPVVDVQSILPSLNKDRFLMMFHDTQSEAVAKGVYSAVKLTGGEMFSIHTRNRLVAVAKGLDPQTIQECREITLRQYL
ncbi:class I SAM-dependent methyltransferase [Bremerella sp. JC770]|uniref:class I SAM-dependent methyltransferase n=1 Tax=Bremerella sp. JC770 TaxID=3232137 RepID=UPI0034589B70